MDLLAFGLALELANKQAVRDMLSHSQASRAGYHADKKEWAKWTQQCRKGSK